MSVQTAFRRVRIETPVGPLVAVTDSGRLQVLQFEERSGELGRALARLGPIVPVEARDPGGVATAFRRYLSGHPEALDAIEVDGPGTRFQKRVWAELRKIPVGTAIAYGPLARRLGTPHATR